MITFISGTFAAPRRIGGVSDMLLMNRLLDLMQPRAAQLAAGQLLAQPHARTYIHTLTARSPLRGSALRGSAQRGSAQVDLATSMNPHTLQTALRAAGATVLTSIWCSPRAPGSPFATRPFGQHAE